jgi:hypothetical protein
MQWEYFRGVNLKLKLNNRNDLKLRVFDTTETELNPIKYCTSIQEFDDMIGWRFPHFGNYDSVDQLYIMRCTGYEDSLGKLIYEGDMLNFSDLWTYTVVFTEHNGMLGWWLKDCHDNLHSFFQCIDGLTGIRCADVEIPDEYIDEWSRNKYGRE